MYFSTLAFSLLPLLVAADWRLWDGPCDTGIFGPAEGSGNFGLMTTGGGGCDGCGATGAGGGYADFESGNPCNCEDILQYKWTGEDYRIIVENTGIDIGSCHETDLILDACTGPNFACSRNSNWECISAYCAP